MGNAWLALVRKEAVLVCAIADPPTEKESAQFIDLLMSPSGVQAVLEFFQR
ncbi:hypothetical protein [Streptomyces nigrescens]|uniref:hypothetical protein n=1 Tax=Streptomyces nigrescens TaxID=1920 RepID=UPI0036F79486